MSEPAAGLHEREDGTIGCWWSGDDGDYQRYHDEEWGRPVDGDVALFEKCCLEGFQAGLSWLTILRKRDNFRSGFAGFDFERVAGFGPKDIERLLGDAGIVRHRGKIESTINNAQRAIEMVETEGSLGSFFWSFEPGKKDRPKKVDHATLRELTKSPESTALSKELKKRGWSFVGPTTMYALMQAMGIVNDHIEGCAVRKQVENERTNFPRP